MSIVRTTVSRRIASFLSVQPGEGRRVAWMVLYSAATIGGFLTIGLAAASSLFLSQLPPSDTPWIFISSAISGVLVFSAYSFASSRVSVDKLVLGSDALLVAIALILRGLLTTRYGSSFPVLLCVFLWVDSGATLVMTQFWIRAAQIFDAREAKRLFGLIAAGGTASSMLAGLGLRVFGGWIGSADLILIVAAALVVCIVCSLALDRQRVQSVADTRRRDDAKKEMEEHASVLDDVRAVFRSPLLRLLAGLTVLVSLLIHIGIYQYFLTLQSVYAGHAQDMVAFMGAYEFWAGIVALVVQLYVTSRVMRRFGAFVALLLFPFAMALGAIGGLLTGGALLAMALVRAADPIFRQTINQSAITVLYLPVPPEPRQRVKVILQIAYALSFGLLGVAFFVSQRVPSWTYITWSFPILALVAPWLLLLRWGAPKYREALAGNLRARRLDFDSTTIDIPDITTAQVLKAALHSPDEPLVIHTLELLGQAPNAGWGADVAPLLKHPSGEVRLLALQRLGAAGDAQYVGTVAAQLHAPEAQVRAAAVEALCAMVPAEVPDRVAPLLADASPAVRGTAILALYRCGGPACVSADAELETLLLSPEPAARVEGARVLASVVDLGQPTGLSPLVASHLIPLFDGTIAERTAAMRAAGALHDASLLPHLLRGLADRATSTIAAEALVRYGPGIEREVDALLSDDAATPDARAVAASVLGRLGTNRTDAVLAAHANEADDTVRGAVYEALVRRKSAGSLPEGLLGDRLMFEIHCYYHWFVRCADLGEDRTGLLGDALTRRMDRALDRICLILELLYPSSDVRSVRRALEPEQGKIRAAAIELLDSLLDTGTKRLLVPLIEGPDEEILRVAQKRLGWMREAPSVRLAELARGGDAWLKACACHYSAGPGGRGEGGHMALSTIERVLILKRADLFGRLSAEDLMPLAERAHEVHFAAGETLIREGDPGMYLYLIVHGEAAIARGGVQVGVRGPYSAIGEMALLLRRSRSADCVALMDVTALEIEQDDFWAMMAERPALAQGVIAVLAQRLDESTAEVQRLSR